MCPKIHATETLTSLIDSFHACCWGVSPAPRKDPWRCMRRWYAGSPSIQRGLPFVSTESCSNWFNTRNLANIALSCLFPWTGPNRLATRTLGAAIDWSFIACTFLCPLYKHLWFCPGLQMGLTVRLINPQQFSSAAPLLWTPVTNSYKCSGLNQSWSKSGTGWFHGW